MDASKARGVFTRLRTQPDGVDPAVLDDGKHYYFLLERDWILPHHRGQGHFR